MRKQPKLRFVFMLTAFAIGSMNFQAFCQSSFDEFKKRVSDNFTKFRDQKSKEFEDFRRTTNEEFAKFLESKWESFKTKPEVKAPVMPSPDPIVIDIDTVKPLDPRLVVITEVAPKPVPVPQPKPVEPIPEIKEESKPPTMTIRLYGTDFILRKPNLTGFRVSGTSGGEISKAWKLLNSDKTNNLINDCLKQREEKQLCDWAYLTLLQKVAKTLTNDDRNSATLLTGFLFSQSGYKMRFATDSNKNLHIFYCPSGVVYGTPILLIDGSKYYRLDKGSRGVESYEICNFSFPGEKPLNFEILRPMNLSYSPARNRQVTTHRHSDIKFEVAVNQNLIDFYNDYPDATAATDPNTKWAIHANTPVSREIKEGVYPVLRQAVDGKSQKDAVNIILKVAQSFPYGYDDEIWGVDRAFFMDESWYYPLSDCEDHAVNFARMVRDILGLDVALVIYPEHLATAVAFTDSEVSGDYFNYDGKRYIVCDPTIFYSNVGMTMRTMDNSQAVLVPLR